MVYDENWAVETGRVAAFFLDQPDVEQTHDGFRFGGCRITLESLPPAGSGFWAIARTRVRMEGPQEDTTQIHSRFFLRFLSAGG